MTRAAFVPCPSCERHVRVGDAACPFCSAELAGVGPARPGLAPGQRLGRAAIFAFGATVGLAACGPSSPSGTDSSVSDVVDDGSTMALYGAAADVVDQDSGSTDTDGGLVAMYGGPPPADSGAAADADDGSTVALYGAAPVDGG